ncbi:MAG: hypothetical protein QF893_14755 [Alphaproteobacteria bacterium]|jgi:hypothetical protein|nr:hypothetical protein [Alphaproteobacteria bacterium]
MAEISYPEDWREIPPERWAKMLMTPEQYTAMRAERLAREARAPAVGEPAPDFQVERLSPAGKRTGEFFRLSEQRGRSLGLVFGSYT